MEFAELIRTPKVDNVILHRPLVPPTEIVLCITGHHMILASRTSKDDELWILHMMVDSVERRQSSVQNSLIIKCKDWKVIQLDIKSQEDLKSVADSIDWLSNLDDFRLFYPFYYRPLFDIIEDGWQTFELEREYQKLIQSSDDWRLSQANRNYKLCPTYPETIIVPKSITDESLVKVAQFRCMGRFPVLSYLHRRNKAVIVRSGQPMLANSNKRCKEDERLINAIIGNKQRGYIIETRFPQDAQLAKGKGGGFEPEAYYPLMRRVHRPIDRYNVLSDSLNKLVTACHDKSISALKWLSKLDQSNWLRHVKDVLSCACLVAQCVDNEGASVLVHGSEGMDSTLQVCALSQLILNPDCRSVQGFEALVEREWLLAGHPFSTRCKHSAFSTLEKKENSPVFLLFLDCVWQITQQYPCSFEFNEDFLLLLLDHAYGSEFGTFLGKCPKERDEHMFKDRTTSLWSHVNRPEILQNYLNVVYEPNDDALWPSVAPQSILLWEGAFLRWTVDMSYKEKFQRQLVLVRAQQKELRSAAEQMRRNLDSISSSATDSLNGISKSENSKTPTC